MERDELFRVPRTSLQSAQKRYRVWRAFFLRTPPRPAFFKSCVSQEATIAAIVEAADSPLSIVIVGVGEGDFTAMEQLDGDRQRLQHPFTGKVASRDMVQFVPFREFSGYGYAAQHALARHVLAEIPGQFISYMETNGIAPNKRGARGPAFPSQPGPDFPSAPDPAFPSQPGLAFPSAPGHLDVPGAGDPYAEKASPMPPQAVSGTQGDPNDLPPAFPM